MVSLNIYLNPEFFFFFGGGRKFFKKWMSVKEHIEKTFGDSTESTLKIS